jgi:hypothetical protein
MTTTLCQATKNAGGVWLSVYHDFHRYESIYTVAHSHRDYYATEGAYVEKEFKSFSAACKYFNRICEKYGFSDSVIW